MNENDILDELLNQSGEYLIINFWEKCTGASCLMEEIMSELESILDARNIDLQIVRLNLGENRDWAMKYKIQGTPSLMIIQNQQVLATIRGKVTLQDITCELVSLGILKEE